MKPEETKIEVKAIRQTRNGCVLFELGNKTGNSEDFSEALVKPRILIIITTTTTTKTTTTTTIKIIIISIKMFEYVWKIFLKHSGSSVLFERVGFPPTKNHTPFSLTELPLELLSHYFRGVSFSLL